MGEHYTPYLHLSTFNLWAIPVAYPSLAMDSPQKSLFIHYVKQRVVSMRCRFFLGLTSPTTCYRVCGRRDHLTLPKRLQSGLVSGLSRLLGSGGSSPDKY